MNDERLTDLLLEWEEARDQGKPVTPEQLCRDCPELLPRLKKKIAALEALNPLLQMRKPTRTSVAAESSQTGSELRLLLRDKLRLANTLFLLVLSLSLVLALVDETYKADLSWLDFLAMGAAVALVGVTQVVLQCRQDLSLRWLRLIETFIFGLGMLLLLWGQHSWLEKHWFETIPRPGQERKLMVIAADSLTMPWFFLMVLYGTFIPNTWRRCAVVVGLMWLMAIGLLVAHGLYNETLGRYMLRDTLLAMNIGLGIAAAIAIYGSHKINVLQTEAFEARKLGQYRLKQKLGSGGMGEVYLAEHQLLRRPCAIKLIRPERADDQRTLKRFEREVRAMATLTHPNTVEIYDYGHSEDGTFYYVMEYLPGLTLEEIVHRYGPLPPERVVYFLRQICGALHEAHTIGLVHRDIKPSNIIVCERGGVHDVAKLLDFGLVKALKDSNPPTRLTIEGAIAGTPLYMSPEQAAISRQLDQRSDLCSLGGVAYFLLTGRPPFVRDTTMQLFAAHISEPVEPLHILRPDVPEDLEAVVLRCLEKDPAKRYPDARSLERALAACGCAGAWTQDQAVQWWEACEAAHPPPDPLEATTQEHITREPKAVR